jgi:ATP-dependent Clp protease ATP-binding subunit ClpB
MTSNTGSHIIQENFSHLDDENKDLLIAKTKDEVFELLQKSIRPEFLNRIDEIIMFTPLSRNEIGNIVRMQFRNVTKQLAEQNIFLSATDEALDWLAQLGYDPIYGARPLKRVIQKRILNELSKEILAGKVSSDSVIELDVFDGKFVFLNKNK